MKKFKKYLKFLFVLPLFFLALFVNLTISADVDETSSSTANTESLFTFDYEGHYTFGAMSKGIISSSFNTQNYSYQDFYNEDLSFIDYASFNDFPTYLQNFYVNVVVSINDSGITSNLTIPCEVIFNDTRYPQASGVDINNQTINFGDDVVSKWFYIRSSTFTLPAAAFGSSNMILEIYLYFNDDNSNGDTYFGSRVSLFATDSNYRSTQKLYFEFFNDLSNFNTYLDSLEGVIDSPPTANITDNLFLSYGIYSNDNQILVNDLFQDSDFTQLNELKPGIIYNLITDEGASANTILISLKNIESNSGYILNMFNGDYGPFELKILGNGGKVLYTQVYDSTAYQISQLLSVVGNDIIIDAISFTFQDIQNAENFYISFTNTLLNETFQNGFEVGIYEGESIGYDKGYDDGYRLGHSDGYNEGMSSQFNLGSTLLEIADIPINVLSSMLSFEVLGINVFGLFTGLVTVLVVLWVVKKFIV